MVKYFDSAYLAKLYLAEQGSEAVRKLAAPLTAVACCSHGRVELAFVFHRKLREGAIDTAGLHARMEQVRDDTEQGFLRWLPVDETLIAGAVNAVFSIGQQDFLRAADALHLVCAKQNGFKTIYSNDRHLLAGAKRFAIRGRDVN